MTKSRRWRAALFRLAVIAWFFVVLVQAPVVGRIIPSADRTLYFKLPIQGARFHWRFLDADAFLSGELTLRIINKGRDQTIVIFRDGKISDGWQMLGDPKPGDGFYFGFVTDHRFSTKATDSLIITLKALKDLPGRGPSGVGTLAAGTWQMTGGYSSIFGNRWDPVDYFVLNGDPPVAYMECWKEMWPLINVTKPEEANGAKPANSGKLNFLGRLFRDRGTNGKLCGSHV